jgi:hypothetical protein
MVAPGRWMFLERTADFSSACRDKSSGSGARCAAGSQICWWTTAGDVVDSHRAAMFTFNNGGSVPDGLSQGEKAALF